MLSENDLYAIGVIVEDKVEKVVDQKLDEKLSPIIKDLDYIKRTLRSTIDLFTKEFNSHEHRIIHLEEKVFVQDDR